MTPSRLVLIANPGTKRCEAYSRAVREFFGEAVQLDVVPWAEVVRAGGCLDDLREFDTPAFVRLESPGKDATVARLLAGTEEKTDLPKGVLHRPGRWYTEFVRVLHGLRQSFDARPHLIPTACPLAVAAMCDKNRTLTSLASADVPVPDFVPPEQLPITPERLLDYIRHLGWPTTYVKLNTGASAVGIVVVRFSATGEPHGLTTLLGRGGRFFNTRRLVTLGGLELQECLTFLLAEGATIQRGVPHARLDGQNTDLRVVCLSGKPVATIFRLSPHRITNLHLGGRRGDWARCRAAIPTRVWLDALDSASAAAEHFDSAIAGVDVLFEPGFRGHRVLEVNAFGDFFPGWKDPSGRSLHQLQLMSLTRRLEL